MENVVCVFNCGEEISRDVPRINWFDKDREPGVSDFFQRISEVSQERPVGFLLVKLFGDPRHDMDPFALQCFRVGQRLVKGVSKFSFAARESR